MSSNDGFAESLSTWTLLFRNAEDEERYQGDMLANTLLSLTMKILTYSLIVLTVMYRIYSLTISYTSRNTKTFSADVEVVVMGATVATIIIELLLRWSGRLKTLHGIFVYTALPISYVTAAFFANNAALFGIQ